MLRYSTLSYTVPTLITITLHPRPTLQQDLPKVRCPLPHTPFHHLPSNTLTTHNVQSHKQASRIRRILPTRHQTGRCLTNSLSDEHREVGH